MLQFLDAVRAQAGARGQRFLRQTCSQPMPPQQVAEGCGCSRRL
jgi:hypothetical protein